MSLRNVYAEDGPRVVVVGAGIIGISTALAILRKMPNVKVTIYGAEFTPNTTADGIAGLWYPYQPGGTSEKNIAKWSKETWDLFESWYKSGDSEVVHCPLVLLDDKPIPWEEWFSVPKSFTYLQPEQLEVYGTKFKHGIQFFTYVVEPRKYLPHLMKSVVGLGGTFVKRKVLSLDELSTEADIIINCTGLGALNLVHDNELQPVRGQLHHSDGTWVKLVMLDNTEEGGCILIPTTDTLVVGVTRQPGNWSLKVDHEDKQEIIKKCCNLVPSLKYAKIVGDFVGLRPVRPKTGVRLEVDQESVTGKGPLVIHNYGHGGSGATLFWGCALDAAKLVNEAIIRRTGPMAKL